MIRIDSPFVLHNAVRGDTLRARLNRGSTLGTREVVQILRDVRSALELAHENGIVHRDIKPENILLVDRGPR